MKQLKTIRSKYRLIPMLIGLLLLTVGYAQAQKTRHGAYNLALGDNYALGADEYPTTGSTSIKGGAFTVEMWTYLVPYYQNDMTIFNFRNGPVQLWLAWSGNFNSFFLGTKLFNHEWEIHSNQLSK